MNFFQVNKKRIFFFLRIFLGLLLAVFLINLTISKAKLDLEELLKSINYLWLMLAFIFYCIGYTFGIIRWNSLLKIQGVYIGFIEAARLTLIGIFFNLTIPGAVGGDIIKMGYIAKHNPKDKTGAVLTIFLDRIIGLIGLFFIALISILLSISFLKTQPSSILTLTLSIASGSIFGIFFFLIVEYKDIFLNLSLISKLIRFSSTYLPQVIIDIIKKLSDCLDGFKNNKKTIFKALCLAIMVHLSLSISLYFCGKALGDIPLTLKNYIFTTQIANTVGAVPLIPGGIGLRDATCQRLLQASMEYNLKQKLSPDLLAKTAAIPILTTFIILTWGIISGFIFMFSKNNFDKSNKEENKEAINV